MRARAKFRSLFTVLLCLTLLSVGYGYATASSTFESHLEDDSIVDGGEQIVSPRDGITVVATDSNSWRGRQSDGPRARAELVAFDPDGSILYYDDAHTRYWDVDPVSGTQTTVEYVFADHLDGFACPTAWDLDRHRVAPAVWEQYERAHGSVGACTLNGVERVNLTTGETTTIWSRVTPGKEATRYHDADRLNRTHLVVADIYLDRVFVVDAETDRIVWAWNATSTFPTDTGGPFPEDWTHINDVEVLPGGRIAVSVRNHDQVVFLDRNGTIHGWTLGAEDDHGVLYEQHNPDYIPVERGGPAVVVADSENNRVVEYARQGGTWKRTWTWRDGRLQWPRDADRLPNGHTLITDSNGNRVLEVDRRGDVVWSVNIAFPYEAERLGTGDESAGGHSAQRADLVSRAGSIGDRFQAATKRVLPGKYLNGLLYVTPVWIGYREFLALVAGTLFAVVWVVVEVYWRAGGALPSGTSKSE